MDDSKLYPASGLALQMVYIALDNALVDAHATPVEYIELCYEAPDKVFPVIQLSRLEGDNTVFMRKVPAAALVDKFLHQSAVDRVRTATMSILPMEATEREKMLGVLIQAFDQNLRLNRETLVGFSIEAADLHQNIDAIFSDNLLLEVADTLIISVSVGLVLEEINPKGFEQARAVAELALAVKAQISWGMVADFENFRKDVLLLYLNLLSLVDALGLDVALFFDVDVSEVFENMSRTLQQPFMKMAYRRSMQK